MYIIMKDVTKTAILFSTVANALFSLLRVHWGRRSVKCFSFSFTKLSKKLRITKD
jgi:hypothetical protein